ncbi:MAG: hypothetical protein PHW62_03145 [Candidatus Ratteibacteria bacterium]|nr:hypothetical protein [Candidatus Ratteibacteria bacterium]
MKKFFKIAGIILGILIILHTILNITFSIQLRNKINELKRQGRPTTIAEIIPPPVPDEENAAIFYNKAFEMMKNEEGSNVKKLSTVEKYLKSLYDLSQWTDEQRKEISELINSKELQDIYSLLEEGSQKTKCNFNLEYEKGPYMELRHLSKIRQAVRFLCMKAVLETESGDIDKAFDTLIVSLKVSNHLKDEPVLFSQQTRYSCDWIITNCIEFISNSKNISPQIAKLIIDELSTHKSVEPIIKCIDAEKVHIGMWVFDRLVHCKVSCNELFGGDYMGERWDYFVPFHPCVTTTPIYIPIWKKDEIYYLTFLSKIQDNCNLPYYKVAQEEQSNPMKKQIPKYCVYTRIIMPYLDRILKYSLARHQANISVCKVGLALKIFKAGTGDYPETLFFLSERSIDPFSGKELIYKKLDDGFILYSLGPNMKDDGGIHQREVGYKEDYDIVWKCEK